MPRSAFLRNLSGAPGSAQARRALDEHAYDRFDYVEAKVSADARRITLAEQDEKWLSRKIDILAVEKVW